jgi:hypothetical protein
MSTNLSSVPKLQFFDANGNPLVGGRLYTYAAGTSTPLATYTDSTGLTPNTNPIILDSRGEANVWLDATQYKFELKTAADALIWTVDNISNALNLSQLLASSGSAAAPPYTFAADPTTGMFLAAAGQIGIAADGVPVLRSTDTTMIIGQSGGSNDVDVTLYGNFTQTGNVALTGDISQTGNFTLDGDLILQGATTETVYALSTTTPALDPSNGGIQTWTLSGNSTPTDSLASGESVLLMIDDGSAYTITWPSVTWKTNSGIAPTLNTTGFTVVLLWKVSSTLYGARVGNA